MTESAEIRYLPDENIRRILMDTQTKYLVVEGEDDIPKYEITLRSLLQAESDFEPIHIGGKEKIKYLLGITSNNNFISIADYDFNGDEMPSDERLIVLTRYSIENYLFCNSVIKPVLASLTNASEASVGAWFCISEWINHLSKKLILLLKSLHFYQKNIATDRLKWTNADINVNNSWEICTEKVRQLLINLFENNVPEEEIKKIDIYKDDEVSIYFPGKLLIKSLYKFIQLKFLEKFGDLRRLNGKINNHNSLVFLCAPFLHRQVELRNELIKAINFLKPST